MQRKVHSEKMVKCSESIEKSKKNPATIWVAGLAADEGFEPSKRLRLFERLMSPLARPCTHGQPLGDDTFVRVLLRFYFLHGVSARGDWYSLSHNLSEADPFLHPLPAKKAPTSRSEPRWQRMKDSNPRSDFVSSSALCPHSLARARTDNRSGMTRL